MAIITAQAPLPTTASSEAKPVAEVIQPQALEAQKPAEEQLSPKFAALARKEKALRQEAQRLKNEADSLKAKHADYETNYIPRSKLQELARNNPLGYLETTGITPDEFTHALLNSSPENAQIQKLQAKLAELESKQLQAQSKFEERDSQQYEQAVHQIRNDVKLLVDGNPTYEMIKDTNSAEAVVELIKETFNSNGSILSLEEAAKQVEEYLVEEALKMAQFNKVKQRLSPNPAPSELPQLKQIQKPALKTLTHDMTASLKPLSNKERRERAIAVFKGQI